MMIQALVLRWKVSTGSLLTESRSNHAMATALAWSLLVASFSVDARDAASILSGPASTYNQLAHDRENRPLAAAVMTATGWKEWKASVKADAGLDIGVDYNALGMLASESAANDGAAGGVSRVYGSWDLFHRDGPNTGSLVFKLENRHSFTDVPPSEFGSELGYVGLVSDVFSDDGWRATHLFWQQRFADGFGISYVGFLDVTDYADLYPFASPWTGFSNLAFQNGSGTMGGSPDGAFGAMIGGFLTRHIYAVGGIVDANGDPTALDDSLDAFFSDFETFKSLELGWTSVRDQPLLDNAHITLWQVDERVAAGTSKGWGVSFSFSGAVGESWTPFLRGGWAKDGSSLYEAAIGAGFGYTFQPGRDLLGMGLHWSRPNPDTFGADLRDQYTLEVFQFWRVTEYFQVTPMLQLIKGAAGNEGNNFTALLGVRLRFVI